MDLKASSVHLFSLDLAISKHSEGTQGLYRLPEEQIPLRYPTVCTLAVLSQMKSHSRQVQLNHSSITVKAKLSNFLKIF